MSWPMMTYCLPSMTKWLVEPCRCISAVMGALFPFAFYWNLSAPLACVFSAWWIHYCPLLLPLPFSGQSFPKKPSDCFWLFSPLCEVYFSSLSRQMSENVALIHLFQMTFQYKFGSMYIRQQTLMTPSLLIYLCGRENNQLSNIPQLMILGKIHFQIQRQRKHSIHILQQTNDTT